MISKGRMKIYDDNEFKTVNYTCNFSMGVRVKGRLKTRLKRIELSVLLFWFAFQVKGKVLGQIQRAMLYDTKCWANRSMRSW